MKRTKDGKIDKSKYLQNGVDIYPFSESSKLVYTLIKFECIVLVVLTLWNLLLKGLSLLGYSMMIKMSGSPDDTSVLASSKSRLANLFTSLYNWSMAHGAWGWYPRLVMILGGLIAAYLLTIALRKHHGELRPLTDDFRARKIKRALRERYNLSLMDRIGKQLSENKEDNKHQKRDKEQESINRSILDMTIEVHTRREINGNDFLSIARAEFERPKGKNARTKFETILKGISSDLTDASDGTYVFGGILNSKDGKKAHFIAETNENEVYLPKIQKAIEKAEKRLGKESQESTVDGNKDSVKSEEKIYTEETSTWSLNLLEDRTAIIAEQKEKAEQEAEMIKDQVELFMQSNDDLRSQLNDMIITNTAIRFKYNIPANKRLTDGSLAEELGNFLEKEGVIIGFKAGFFNIDVPLENRIMADSRTAIVEAFEGKKLTPLTAITGIRAEGNPDVRDFATAPHTKVGGGSGSGKSVGINQFVLTMMKHTTPDEVRFVFCDPKMVEFGVYKDNPFMLFDPVIKVSQMVDALEWLVIEQQRRYYEMSKYGIRNIHGYNKKMKQEGKEPWYTIFAVVDEMGDIMKNKEYAQKVEDAIVKLGQKARAAGIHLLLATQSPRVEIMSGLIQANTLTGIAYSVSKNIESRIILEVDGAEKLAGYGDSMVKWKGQNSAERVAALFFSDEEVERINTYLKKTLEQTEKVDFVTEVAEYDGRYESGETDESSESESKSDKQPLKTKREAKKADFEEMRARADAQRAENSRRRKSASDPMTREENIQSRQVISEVLKVDNIEERHSSNMRNSRLRNKMELASQEEKEAPHNLLVKQKHNYRDKYTFDEKQALNPHKAKGGKIIPSHKPNVSTKQDQSHKRVVRRKA